MSSQPFPFMKSLLLPACLFFILPIAPLPAGDPPPLQPFATISSDAVGRQLQTAFIWTGQASPPTGVAVGFRKTLELPATSAQALLHVFADARYVLWVNGDYVERGPNRFQPNGPEYDSIDLSTLLRPGTNALAILVIGNLSGGKVMRHVPGLTALIEVNGKVLAHTDASWKWSDQTRYRQCAASWPNLGETLVDARIEDGDWTRADYRDAAWKPAAGMGGESRGALTARRIPRLREKPVPFQFTRSVSLPVRLAAGEKLEFKTTRIVQAYPLIEFTADPNTEITIEPFNFRYLARAGSQSHFTLDTRGLSSAAVVVKTGAATITGLKLIERLYPFDRVGSFTCNDPQLNRLWTMCARSCEVLSEDAYVDCADRERVEWMDCDPPGFDVTRTIMAGPGPKPCYADPRLLGEMLRRTALTLQPDGWVKAHTCSDRYDIHAKMEDRACEWVAGLRRYYDATGDRALLREIWPAVVAQMNYFIERRTERGLVRARDWVVWGNPTGYLTGEGTTLNVFVQRALSDSAMLAGLVDDPASGTRFARAAEELKTAINTVLWDEAHDGYYSGYFTEADLAENTAQKRTLKLARTNGLAATGLHANVFALDRGVVPPERRERVLKTVVEEERTGGGRLMLYYYLSRLLFGLDQPEHDCRVLQHFRDKWAKMAAAPWECSWEDFNGGSKAHCYGMYPGYFLSAYVLGVRRDAPVAEKKLVIEPHLGDLTEAAGIVVTEFGPVDVAWKLSGGALNFEIQVPPGAEVRLRLPTGTPFQLNGNTAEGAKSGRRMEIVLPVGKSSGSARLEAPLIH